jgi:hypothetical protein
MLPMAHNTVCSSSIGILHVGVATHLSSWIPLGTPIHWPRLPNLLAFLPDTNDKSPSGRAFSESRVIRPELAHSAPIRDG